MNIKIIAGANFGDEGKGLMTDYFAYSSREKCINIKHNGGSQAGHTVITPDKIKHVFSHFGSGTFSDSDTYLSEDFIVNPIIFKKELCKLKQIGISPVCFVNKNCLVTTPYDMLINQVLEHNRKSNKHGSCGLGIYETILRNKFKRFTVSDFNKSNKELKNILNYIRNIYIPKRLEEEGIYEIPKEIYNIIENEFVIENFIEDLSYFYNNIYIAEDSIILNYNSVLFESGQGLLLDKENILYMPHLTPSYTGIKNPVKIIKSLNKSNENIEICYVSRTYITRHGAGRFDTECKKENINPLIFDSTNILNEFQDELRYGFFDINLFAETIKNDLKNFDLNNNYLLSTAFTHLNETNNTLKCKDENLFIDNKLFNKFKSLNLNFNKYYISDNYTRNSVKEVKLL